MFFNFYELFSSVFENYSMKKENAVGMYFFEI